MFKDDKSAEDIFPPKPVQMTRQLFNQWLGEECKTRFITREQLEKCQAEAKLKGDINCYFVAAAGNTSALADQVNEKLKQGFRLWGDVTSDEKYLYQAMVK